MQNIWLVVYKYICFMSTLADYREYQLKDSEMTVRKSVPPLYYITKGIPGIAQKWPEILQYLLTGNIDQMSEAPCKAPSSREVSCERKGMQAEESEMEEAGDDVSEDSQLQENEADPVNPIMAAQDVHATSQGSGMQRSSKGNGILGS